MKAKFPNGQLDAGAVASRFAGLSVWLSLAIGAGIGMRLVGALVNTEANDAHIDVIRIVAYEHRFPAHDELWEAFQPKLYHTTVAAVLNLLPPIGERAQIVVAQAVSCAAGIAALFVLMAFVRRLRISAHVQQIVIALIALNPQMIGTSIQATNDSFVILFGSVALAAGYGFFRAPTARTFWGMVGGAILAATAKGNGLVVAIAIACAFIAALIRGNDRPRFAALAAIFLIAFGATVPLLGGYWSRYQETGSPFGINQDPAPAPQFFEESVAYGKRPGITSVFDGFFTFRLVSMMQEPFLSSGDVYPRHRTSFWSLIYGGSHSVHYEYWPYSWRSNHPAVLWLLRIIWIVALPLTLLLAIGIVRSTVNVVMQFASRRTPSDWMAHLLMALSASGYIGFLMLFGYRYRDYGTMKPIFIYPAAVAFIFCFVRELDRLMTRSRGGAAFIRANAAILCLAYALDVSFLLVALI